MADVSRNPQECTCGKRFLLAEDFRDHLPCEGTEEQQEIRRLRRVLRAVISNSVADTAVDGTLAWCDSQLGGDSWRR